MKYWKIKYVIDTGYDWSEHTAICIGESESAVLDNLKKNINSQLRGDDYILSNRTEIEEIIPENGIILVM